MSDYVLKAKEKSDWQGGLSVSVKLYKKHKGAALLGIVLAGFIVLSIFAAIAISVAYNSIMLEKHQTDIIVNRRLDALARSGVLVLAERIKVMNGDAFDTADNLVGYIAASDRKTIVNDTKHGISMDMQMFVRKDSAANDEFSIKTVVYEGARSKDAGANLIITGTSYDITWRTPSW